MKNIVSVAAALLATSILAVPALALDAVAPPVLSNAGLKDLTDAYTGAKVTTRTVELMNVAQTAQSAPTDVVFNTADHLDGMKADIAPGSIVKIGRVNIVLAVRAGSPHPDISTAAKLIAVLKSAKNVVHSNPDPVHGSLSASLIDQLLKRPEFAGVHNTISTKGNGAAGLINGEGDMTLQFESEVLPHKELEVVGALPVALGAYADLAAGVMAKAADPAGAKAYIAFVTRPDADPVWKSHGLTPAH